MNPRSGGPSPGVTIDLRGAQSPSYRGRGVGRYATALTTALVAEHRHLVERVILSPDLPPPQGAEALVDQGITTTATRWAETGGAYHLMAPFDPDRSLSTLWPPVVTARRMRLIMTVYDLIPDALPEVYLGDPGRRRRYRARRQLLRCADHLVAISESAAFDVGRYLGLAAAGVTVIGGACDPMFVRPPSPAEAKHRAAAALRGLGGEWVFYNGAIEPRKNTEGLIEAYAALPAAIRERWQLVVACALAPLERNHLEVRARQLGIAGRLILPGYVRDDTLVALNQGADLVVFPSLYEGFGLPVAEGLACGAAVIASGNSAPAELVAPEAVFDPRSLHSITAAMERGLTDPEFRASLLDWASKPPLRWDQVAERTAAVYRALLAEPTRRPRTSLALVTPWPPQRTGVADYNAALVAALAPKAEVDVYVDGDDPGAAGLGPFALGLPPRLLPRAARYRGGYDGVVVAVGNSEFHAGGLGLLRHHDLRTVVMAHDVRLTGLYRHSAARGAVPEGYAAAFAAMYPGLLHLMRDGWIPPEVAIEHGILMARELIGRAGVFTTTSGYAADLARLDAAPGDAGRVAVLPYAYPAVAQRSKSRQPGLVCSFGIVSDVKRPLLLIQAMALLAPSTPPARLVFVGPAGEEQHQAIRRYATHHSVSVEVVGFTAPEVYAEWLQRTEVAVQLRRDTNGETSGAVADCITHGVATIVSDVGTSRDLPPSVLRLAPTATAAELAALIGDLLEDPERRRRLGRAAQRWAAARGFDGAADDLLALVAAQGAP